MSAYELDHQQEESGWPAAAVEAARCPLSSRGLLDVTCQLMDIILELWMILRLRRLNIVMSSYNYFALWMHDGLSRYVGVFATATTHHPLS